MNDNKSSGQFPIPGIALVMLALGFFVFTDNTFNPTRPEAPSELTSTAEDVRARLWQDPFEAVEVHRKNKHSGGAEEQLVRIKSQLSALSMHQDQQHKVCDLNPDDGLSESRVIRAAIAGMDAKNFRMILSNTVVTDTSIKNSKDKVSRLNKTLNAAKDADKKKIKENLALEESILKRKVFNYYVQKLIRNSAHTVDELRCQIYRDIGDVEDGKDNLHVIAVMVPGGPYAEDREKRIRNRYAVVAGLSHQGYVPTDSEHIGYMNFSGLCQRSIEGYPVKSKYCDWPATIPYEWFKREETIIGHGVESAKTYADKVLVLWLDDEEISQEKPLSMLDRLREALTPGQKEKNSKKKSLQHKNKFTIKFDVLGPASSTTLLSMFREVDDANCIDLKEECFYKHEKGKKKKEINSVIRIISSRATIDDGAISNIRSNHLSKVQDDTDQVQNDTNFNNLEFKIKYSVEKVKHVAAFHLMRTIPTDDQLVNSLLCELVRRGVNPFMFKTNVSDNKRCSNFSPSSFDKVKGQHHIVLIGEWDTNYSRNFNRLFKDSIMASSEDDEPDWLHGFYYFRGIDGAIGQQADSDPKSDDGKGARGKAKYRRPVGANQFDYLRRLGDQLTHLSDSIKKSNETIRAIGIVGSDTYDKLLVLQALRNRFPDVVFFTTDLDARMLHSDENKWARNLIVASGFGLSPDGYEEVLPFRDSYQTALYLSTIKAMKTDIDHYWSNNKIFDDLMTVKMFEVGNKEAIDYSNPDDDFSLGSRMVQVKDESTGFVFYLSLSLVLVFLLIYLTSNQTRVFIAATAVIVYLVLAWVASFDTSSSVEYHNMLSGTSIWPAIIIRMIASVLSAFFIFYTLSGLRVNTNKIIKKHELEFEGSFGFSDGLIDSLKKIPAQDSSFMLIIKEIFYAARQSVLNVFKRRYFHVADIDERKYKKLSIPSRFFITAWGWRFDENKKISIDELMYEYLELGRTGCWSCRVIPMFVIYMLIATLFLFSFSSVPFTSFSDEVSFSAHKIVLITSVTLYTFLIFLVVDVTRLNARFVQLLYTCDVSWPEKKISEYVKEIGVCRAVAVEKLKLDLIVERSKSVDVLIFLPFVILSLMIISRSSYFDRWYMPLHLGIVIFIGALIALSSAIRLRRTANKARHVILGKLTDALNVKMYEESIMEAPPGLCKETVRLDSEVCDYKMTSRIERIIGEVKNIREGPFRPLSQHPIISAIAMPFGGVGGLYLIDYFANLGV